MGVACNTSRMEAWPYGWSWIVAPFIQCSHWLFPPIWGWTTSTPLKGKIFFLLPASSPMHVDFKNRCRLRQAPPFALNQFQLTSHFPECLLLWGVCFVAGVQLYSLVSRRPAEGGASQRRVRIWPTHLHSYQGREDCASADHHQATAEGVTQLARSLVPVWQNTIYYQYVATWFVPVPKAINITQTLHVFVQIVL